MAFSGSYDFTMTASDVCTLALEKIGVVGENQQPTGNQLSKARQQLNLILKELENQGYKFWTTEQKTFNTNTSNQTYSIDADISEIEYAFIRDEGIDTPLAIYTRFDEADIQNKTDEGKPTAVRFTRNNNTQTLTLYPKPDKVYAIYYGKSKIIQDVDIGTNNLDVLTNWLNALVYGLASELGDSYQIPLQERDRFEAKAGQKFRAAKMRSKEFTTEVIVKGRF